MTVFQEIPCPKKIGIWGNSCTYSAEMMLKAEYDTIPEKVGVG